MKSPRRLLFVVLTSATLAPVAAQREAPATAPIQLWATREYSSWDNPLHTEITINEKLVNIFTSDKMESIGDYLKPGWNVVTLKTTPQEPADKANGLIFRIGPTHKDAKNNKIVMEPVLWEFRNTGDWKLGDGKFSHPLGPGTKEVVQTYNLYLAPLESESRELKAGDYILSSKPTYSSWNTPVVGTVFINGTPLSSFTVAKRDIVITQWLKEGRNEVKLVSTRVKNTIKSNDVEFDILGPAEWNVGQSKFVAPPVLQFKAMQGWTMDARTGMLINKAKPDSETIERVLPFVLKTAPGM